MRLISQDGITDISYARFTICACGLCDYNTQIGRSEINGYTINAERYSTCIVMGRYSTKEKALKVMEMLQQAYLGRNEALDLDMAEGTDEEMKDIMLRHGFGTLFVTRTNINPQADFRPLHTYFKFPADEEVET